MTNSELQNAHSAARAAIWELAKFGGVNTKLAMQYIGLFSMEKRKLDFANIFQLLCELNTICQEYAAEHWQQAAQSIIDDALSGSLKVPLQNHNELRERLANLGTVFFNDCD